LVLVVPFIVWLIKLMPEASMEIEGDTDTVEIVASDDGEGERETGVDNKR
jgi:hypothetical protein